jgi:hypothetical protein
LDERYSSGSLPTLTTQLEDRFDVVRRRLAARYEFLAAVAFHHESSLPGR